MRAGNERMLPTDWIRIPEAEIHGADSGTPSAVIQLRNRPPAYSVQPNPECLVFFHLGDDHWPVSVEFFEPISGRAAFRVLVSLFEKTRGEPAAVQLTQAHQFHPLSSHELTGVLRAMDEAQGKLESATK